MKEIRQRITAEFYYTLARHRAIGPRCRSPVLGFACAARKEPRQVRLDEILNTPSVHSALLEDDLEAHAMLDADAVLPE